MSKVLHEPLLSSVRSGIPADMLGRAVQQISRAGASSKPALSSLPQRASRQGPSKSLLRSKGVRSWYENVKSAEMKRWMAVSTEQISDISKGSRRTREEQLEAELALNHPEVLALSKIKQHKPTRALEVLKQPLEALQAKSSKLTSDERLRLYHLLGLRLLALVELKEIRQAMFVADEQIALRPDCATGLSNRGFVQESSGDFYSAAETQRKAIELATKTHDPKSPYLEAHYRLATALRSLEDLPGALEALEVILQHDPAHYDTLCLKASIYLEMGRVEVARELFLEAVRMDGSRPEAYAELGNLFYGNGAYEHATNFLKEALKRDPQHINALVYMGNVLVMTNYLQEAMTTYESALLLDPKNTRALLSKAALLGRLRKFEEAINTVDYVISNNSNIAHAYVIKGEALDELNQTEEAIQAFERAIDTNPHSRRAYIALFKVLHGIGNMEKLEDMAHKASQTVNDFEDAYFYMGIVQSAFRRWKEAKVSYSKALSIHPTYAQAAYSLALCLIHLNELDQSFEILEKSEFLDRKSVTYCFTLASVLTAASRLEEAVEALDRAIAVDPQSHVLLQMRASHLNRLGRYEDALVALDQVIAVSPNPARFHLYKGYVYTAQHNYPYALDCFDIAIEIDPLIRPLAIKGKVKPLQALDRHEEADQYLKQLEEISVDNPANQREAEPELQYKPIQQNREENSEEDDIKALKDAVDKIRSEKA